MKSLIEFTGIVQNGRLPEIVRQSLTAYVKSMEGKRVTVTLRQFSSKRSNNQNAYYWSVVIPHVMAMFAEAGNDIDKDGCHEFLKLHVGNLKDTVTDPAGVRRTISLQSRKLSKPEWEDYMQKIRAWAAEFGYQIPLPHEE